MQQKRTLTKWMLVGAVGNVAILCLPSALLAQYQTENNSGRLLDANNRLGSSGTNDASQAAAGVSGNDIVYGNVTRGRQFHGTASTDPRAFRGNLDRNSDNLIRDAGPSAYERGGTYDPYAAQRFWGDSKGVNAPPGFQQLTPGSSGQFVVDKPVYRTPGDLRLDDAMPNPSVSAITADPFGVTTTYLGPLGTSPTAVDVPETDVKGQPSSELRDIGRMPSRQLLERLHLDESTIRRMREELRNGSGTDQQDPRLQNPYDLTTAAENPDNTALGSQLSSDVQANAMGGSLETNQSMRQNLVTASRATARQSSQYAELQKRLERFRARQTMSDEQANQQFMQDWTQAQEAAQKKSAAQRQQDLQDAQLRAQQEAANAGKPQPEAARSPDQMKTPGPDRAHIAAKLRAEEGAKPEGLLPPQPDIPLKITSFADGVKASGLKELLGNAEKSMRAGKFTQALDYYDAAASVAPNNSLIITGRSVAELGAGYYARAQIHLEQVLSADPALLMARYDLKGFYGEDRLQYIVRDLKDLAQTEQRQSRPLFLLAFIAYNTENEQRTSDYLTMAEQRGGNKEFYAKLREYWKLPKPGEQLNK